jgi:hypothetical protein
LSEHLTVFLLKSLAIVGGLAWFGWHMAVVLAQAVPVPEAALNLAVNAGSTGAIVGVLYWAINRVDRIIKELLAEREADERRREERWIAHDAKREETLRLITDRYGIALDRNSEALARNDTTLRRCEERHVRDEQARKATG